MKYLYLATAQFAAVMSAYIYISGKHIRDSNAVELANNMSFALLICALALAGMYAFELIKEDNVKALPCK